MIKGWQADGCELAVRIVFTGVDGEALVALTLDPTEAKLISQAISTIAPQATKYARDHAIKSKRSPNIICNARGQYWSADHGWVAVEMYATRYSNLEKKNTELPEDGSWGKTDP